MRNLKNYYEAWSAQLIPFRAKLRLDNKRSNHLSQQVLVCPILSVRKANIFFVLISAFMLLALNKTNAQGLQYTTSGDVSICYGSSTTLKVTRLDSTAVFHSATMDYIQIPSHSEINTTVITDRTIALWFRAGSTTGRQVLYEEGGVNNGLNIYLLNGKVYVSVWGSNIILGELSATVSAGVLHHVAMVIDGGLAVNAHNFKFYLDGALQSSSYNATLITGIPAHNSDIHIGYSGNTRYTDGTNFGNFYFNGGIDEFKLWNSALTTAQVAAEMWNETSGATNQIIRYDFNNDNATTIFDVSGATLHNGIVVNSLSHDDRSPFKAAFIWDFNGSGSTESYSIAYRNYQLHVFCFANLHPLAFSNGVRCH
ncbi:MAG: LamG domain-containing protein [Mangrovibacterium sp.]